MSNAKIILDTNIVSYLMKGGDLAKIYAPHMQGKLLAISFVTVGELYFWAEDAHWGVKKRLELETRLRNFVVIPYDHTIAQCFGKVSAECKHKGRKIELNDAWIAACAVRHGIPLVTHNAKHFAAIDALDVVSEQKWL